MRLSFKRNAARIVKREIHSKNAIILLLILLLYIIILFTMQIFYLSVKWYIYRKRKKGSLNDNYIAPLPFLRNFTKEYRNKLLFIIIERYVLIVLRNSNSILQLITTDFLISTKINP